MIFKQLNEKMRAMDRSLLEKVAADIEMMDKNQGMYMVFKESGKEVPPTNLIFSVISNQEFNHINSCTFCILHNTD